MGKMYLQGGTPKDRNAVVFGCPRRNEATAKKGKTNPNPVWGLRTSLTFKVAKKNGARYFLKKKVDKKIERMGN